MNLVTSNRLLTPAFIFALCSGLAPLGSLALAQTADEPLTDSNGTVFSVGVSGQMDTKDRSPVISVGSSVTDGNVTLLLNSYVRDKDTAIYPTKFEVFIANKMVASLIKTSEQGEPLVVPIDPSIGTAPLSYTVHAQIIHPSRTFSSVTSGQVFNSTLSGSLNCTVTQTVTDAEAEETTELTYTAEDDDVQIEQLSDTSLSLSIKGKTEGEDPEEITITGTVEIDEESAASSDLSVEQDGDNLLVATTGTVEIDDEDKISGLRLRDEEEELIVVCGE
jgi:hypothetical protein